MLPLMVNSVPFSRVPVVSTMTSVPGWTVSVLPAATVMLPVTRMFSSGPQIRLAPVSAPDTLRQVGSCITVTRREADRPCQVTVISMSPGANAAPSFSEKDRAPQPFTKRIVPFVTGMWLSNTVFVMATGVRSGSRTTETVPSSSHWL